MTTVRTDEKEIDVLLEKGVENIFPSKEYFKKELLSGKQLTIYHGIDPTGPSLHLGHTIPLRKLRDLQRLGHKIILLIGDFTAMIGDPTGKYSTRKSLTREEVLTNATVYKQQASRFLHFEGDNPAQLKYNSEWLSKMNFGDVLSLASHMTVQEMLKRDMFETRMEEGKPIYIHEFMYPLMQGYDSVALDTDGEVGGNDQTFNMLAGRTLLKQYSNKEKFVIALKLLTDPSGKKMGKSEGNMIMFDDNPFEIYGKIMSWTDDMILPGFELCTDLSLEEISSIRADLDSGSNPRDSKMILARTIVGEYYSEEKAQEAEEQFIATFKKGEIPDDVLEVNVEKGTLLADIVTKHDLVPSKTEFRRLVDQKAITWMEREEVVTDHHLSLEENATFKIGKKRFIKIKVK